MARLPALISAIAQFDPRGEATVENHARKLRAGGLMTTGKRGVGAPEMTARDGSGLLISMVSRRADEVVETVADLRNAEIEPGHHTFIRDFPFYERTKDENGCVRAGLFFDGMMEDLMTMRNALMFEGKGLMLDAVEVYDPKTGFGRIVFTFGDIDNNIKKVAFNAMSLRMDGSDELPPIQIQNSIFIPGYIVLKTVQTLLEAAA